MSGSSEKSAYESCQSATATGTKIKYIYINKMKLNRSQPSLFQKSNIFSLGKRKSYLQNHLDQFRQQHHDGSLDFLNCRTSSMESLCGSEISPNSRCSSLDEFIEATHKYRNENAMEEELYDEIRRKQIEHFENDRNLLELPVVSETSIQKLVEETLSSSTPINNFVKNDQTKNIEEHKIYNKKSIFMYNNNKNLVKNYNVQQNIAHKMGGQELLASLFIKSKSTTALKKRNEYSQMIANRNRKSLLLLSRNKNVKSTNDNNDYSKKNFENKKPSNKINNSNKYNTKLTSKNNHNLKQITKRKTFDDSKDNHCNKQNRRLLLDLKLLKERHQCDMNLVAGIHKLTL